MKKINYKDAIEISNYGFYLMHLEWFKRRNPRFYCEHEKECSHFLISVNGHYSDPKYHRALVLSNSQDKLKYYWESRNQNLWERSIMPELRIRKIIESIYVEGVDIKPIWLDDDFDFDIAKELDNV